MLQTTVGKTRLVGFDLRSFLVVGAETNRDGFDGKYLAWTMNTFDIRSFPITQMIRCALNDDNHTAIIVTLMANRQRMPRTPWK